ncbi:WD repeat-containing protein 70-like [Mya arenaria]|uniref:WD repeat-containing protein 70-like n=1 Tax=Mya arenaria TaxID=6604 RepID=UPI0022DEE19B|nr:WD repeat-containing protein 70-like [Mya arenaria]
MADKDGTKKARQFDFMSMFEEARQTAIERTTTSDLSKDIDGADAEETVARINKQTKALGLSVGKEGAQKAQKKTTDHSSSGSDSSDSDDEMIGPPVPKPASAAASDDEDIGPPLPPEMKSSGYREATDDDEGSGEEEEESLLSKIPSSLNITLEHGKKTVSALALDPSGARLVTGGNDYDVKLFDFAGMDSTLKPFRSLRPCECHPIKQLQYSSTGDMILVVAGNSQAKVLDRDGHEKFECKKGDQYLADMAQTKGHAAMLNSGCFNPKVKAEFMTCSNDGTVRLWDVNDEGKKQRHVIKPRSQQGRRVVPTTCAYSHDGRWVVAACQDGSLQLWDHNRPFVNVSMLLRTAHMNGSDTTSLCFSYDGRVLASRGGDDTVKLWDIRSLKKPLAVRENLPNYFPNTDVLFSPDDRLVLTGLSVKKNEGKGKLLFMDRESLGTLTELEVSDLSVVRCIWHPRLNQFVVGCGDGKAQLYYDEHKSHRGAKLCVAKKPSKTKQMEIVAHRQIITPYALPMFRQQRESSTKKQDERARKDPVLSRRPDLPVYGPGSGGRLATKGGTLSQYVVQTLVMQKEDQYEDNPREAILRHAKFAEENPLWVAPAYKKTQPQPIFQGEEEKVEETDIQPPWKKQKKT